MGTECEGSNDSWPAYPATGKTAQEYLTEIIGKAGCPTVIKNLARKCRNPEAHGQHCATATDLDFRLETVIAAHTKVMNGDYGTQAQIDAVLKDLNHEGGGKGKKGKGKGKSKGGKAKPAAKPKPTGKPKPKPKGKGKNK